MKYSHYFKSVAHLNHIDVYRVLDLFSVTDAALGHAAKKILCAGVRGAKDQAKDVQEAIDTLTRWQQMQSENHIVEVGEIVDKMIDSVESGKALAHKTNATNNRPFVDIPECKTRETKRDLWVDDKELPGSGIYGDQGYTEQDLRSVADLTAHTADTRNSPVGGALVHDAEAVIGDWIEYDGKGQPVGDDVEVSCRGVKWIDSEYIQATHYEWEAKGDYTITHYRVKE